MYRAPGDGWSPLSLVSRISRITRPLDAVAKYAGADRAAVTLIIHDSEDLDALFVKRVVSAVDPWSGQIAFPGGRFEHPDNSIIDTAIRETHEETGIDLLSQSRLVGALDDVRPINKSDLVVTPFVALVEDKPTTKPSSEIEETFWASLRGLERVTYETTLTTGAKWRGEAFRYKNYVVWGMTGHIIDGFLSRL